MEKAVGTTTVEIGRANVTREKFLALPIPMPEKTAFWFGQG